MGYALERLNNKNEIRVLDENKPYFCGRDKSSSIVCFSPTISRKHCIFYVNKSGVTVLDLQSSNGVYINGEKIPAHDAVTITVNDIIGLGSCALDNFTASDFVYRLKLWDGNSKTNLSNGIWDNKRKLKSEINDEEEIPSKIIKTEDNESIEIIEISDDGAPMEISSGEINSSKTNSINEKLKNTIENNTSVTCAPSDNEIGVQLTNSVWIKYEDIISDDENIFDKPVIEQIEYSSPLKLKMPKEKSKSRYSGIDDVVHLSDEDEDVFPCSQLFDNFIDTSDKNIDLNKIKKEENINEEYNEDQDFEDAKDLFHSQETEPPYIILSDDEDDDDDDNSDNPWIRRLLGSQSQRDSIIAESKNNETVLNTNTFVDENKQEDIEYAQETDKCDKTIHNIIENKPDNDEKFTKQDEIKNKKSKSLNCIDDEENNKINDEKEYCKEQNSKVKKEDVKKGRYCSIKIDRIKIDEKTKIITSISDSIKSTHTDETLNKINNITESHEFHAKSRSKKKIIEKLIAQSAQKSTKKILQIEPPFLPKGEKYGISCAVTTFEKSITNENVEIEKHSNDYEETSNLKGDVGSTHNKYTSKQTKKEFLLQQKLEDAKYMKEQKLRRLKYKFANILPPRKARQSPMTREEREELTRDRKERLKIIANTTKKPDENHTILKRINKPKAKVSTKNRGDFLIPDQLDTTISNDDADKLRVSEKKIEVNINNLSRIKKSKIQHINENLTNHENKIAEIKQKEISINSYKNSTNEIISVKKKQLSTHEEQIKSNNCIVNIEETGVAALPTPKTVIKNKNPKKKVSFNEEKPTVHTFIIAEGNNLNKCVRTDLLLKERPLKKFRNSNVNDLPHPRFEEFLLRLFHWNPVWLQEQLILPSQPPVVDQKSLIPVLSAYKSFEDYYRVMSPLLALEMWHGISKDFLSKESKKKRITFQASVVENSVSHSPIPSSNHSVTTFMLEALATKTEIEQQTHPIFGDLVAFEFTTVHKGRTEFLQIFAYVTSVTQSILTPFTRYNRDLAKHVKNPHTLLTYTMITRPLKIIIPTNVVQRLKTISYLRSSMRMVQALQYLPLSPLSKLILQPNAEAYKLPEVTNCASYPLVTKDKLNPKQMEAVLRITNTVIQRIPKISMIQGPPGTGKTKVIVNIITEILYGDNRYQNKKHPRILVCAPSNAAIDEIVLRLLAIRANFQPKEQRFRLVRLGRTDTMNPGVKSISVTELARRDSEKMISEYRPTDYSSLESIELEKSFLIGRINAVEAEIDSTVDSNYKQHLQRKLTALRVKYDLLNNRDSNKNIDRKILSKLQRIAESTILTRADIITCTLSSCYTNQMEAHFGGNKERISVCIVDEATQSIEAETLIPLMLGVTTLVLVGDPNQLPATVISQQAKKLGMDQSLFARLHRSFEGNPINPVIMLDTQYRMSYPISYWPNRYFYGNRLKNCAKMHPLPFFFYKILNLTSTQDEDRFSNTNEAIFVANIIYTMMTYSNLDKLDNVLRIGVITPYNNQRTIINDKLKERLTNVSDTIRKKVITEVNTVDSFQGQERDVIIMSCVRSNGIGFLSDHQRLCVALTRAKHSLIICGNFKTFEKDKMWAALLKDARFRGVYFDVDYKCEPETLKRYIIK